MPEFLAIACVEKIKAFMDTKELAIMAAACPGARSPLNAQNW